MLPARSAIDFSLILPTYNERENLAHLVAKIDGILIDYNFEVIVVDDDSPDDTWEEAQRLQRNYGWLRVIRRRGERGLSSAVMCGFRHARGNILGVMDADLQHDTARLPQLLCEMKQADFAIATRRAAGGSNGQWNCLRRFVSQTATLVTKVIARVPLSDPMSGFFMMRREIFVAIDDWTLRPRGYKLLLYLYSRALQCMGRENLRLSEVGYEFGQRQHGRSKLSAKVMFQFIAMLFDIRLHPRHESVRAALLPARS